MIKIPTIPRPKEGCFVFVTQRICSEKLQPSIKLNTPYRFVQETQTESGIRSVVIQPLKNPKNSTINEKRFKWSYTSQAQLKAYYKEQTTQRKHIQPDTAAIIFTLTNGDPDHWRSRQSTEVTGKDGKDLFKTLSDEELDKQIADLEKKLKQ